MRRPISVLLSLFFLLFVPVLSQQGEEGKNKQYEGLKNEVLQLRLQLDSLKAVSQITTSDDEIDRVSERLEKRLQELENKIDAISRSSAAIVFNPRTTAFLNFAARGDNKTVLEEQGTEISNRPFLRTVELDLRAPVDPYAEAITIITLEDEAGKGFAIDAEEAYGLIKRLPILETAPLGLKFKVGKYRAPLGQNNKMHMHDLPWTTRPLVIAKFLGTEHGDFFESGYNPVGMDFDFYLPNPIPGSTLEMNADVVRGGDLGLTHGHGGNQPAFLGHLNLAADWNNEHLLVLGASGYRNTGISSTTLLGVDFLYKWAPSERRESRSFVVGGEAFLGKHTYQDTIHNEVTTNPFGWYAFAQYQLSYWLYVGLRYDSVEEPVNDKLITQSVAAYASYYTTEFLRFRLGFEHRASDFALQDNVNSVILEINFVFGSHPTEPYWVNR